MSTKTDGFNAFMRTLAKDKPEDRKKTLSKTATTVLLTEEFRRLSDALGSSVKAAYSCEDFVRFLDKVQTGNGRVHDTSSLELD